MTGTPCTLFGFLLRRRLQLPISLPQYLSCFGTSLLVVIAKADKKQAGMVL